MAASNNYSVEGAFHRWLTVEQIRKMQRMRRETVLAAIAERRIAVRAARPDSLRSDERRVAMGGKPVEQTRGPEHVSDKPGVRRFGIAGQRVPESCEGARKTLRLSHPGAAPLN